MLLIDDPGKLRVSAYAPTTVKIVNLATIVYGEANIDETAPGFTYPGEPLLGIKALASGQISGDLDVQVDAERSKVWVYTGSEWEKLDANNHAWAVYDILAQGHVDHPAYPTYDNINAEAIYGCGIDKDRLDYESFREWADNIDVLEYSLNIVFDTFMTAWDAILRICQEGRGMVYPVGAKIYAFTDKAADATQLFTMGNIHADTFVQRFMGATQKINMIETTFYDAERNYEKTTLATRTADWDSTDGPSIPISIILYGTTSVDQGWSIPRFLLRGNELLNNIISFGVDVDALAAQAGDVVEVQHDVLNAGRGGRIVSYAENLISNPSFETRAWTPWTIWNTSGNPNKRQIITTTVFTGTYSWWHQSATTNSGNYQTFTVLPSTVYTLSCWAWIIEDYTGTDSIRVMTSVDGEVTYDSGYADISILGSWQRLSVTVTTGVAQTSMTMWVGGKGNCYFDAIQVEQAAAVTDWMQQARVTLDREVTLAGDDELIVWRDGVRITKTTSLNTGETRDNILYITPWAVPPQQYDIYSFGADSTTIVNKYRITEISRTDELMRTLTLVQYDAALYDSYTPADADPVISGGYVAAAKVAPPTTLIETIADLLNIATNVQIREVVSRNRTTGQYESSLVVTWDPVNGDPRGTWEVWLRDVDASDDGWQGSWEAGTYGHDDKVEYDGKAYISLEDENTSTPVNV